jgi:PAS domain S-box-containing protein
MTRIQGIRTVPRAAIIMLLFLWAAGFSTTSLAQQGSAAWPERRFQNLSAEQGLPDGRVWGITQDQKGFLWFGTHDGLSRFDGYEFKTYRPDPQDPNCACALQFQVLFADRAGMLWFGSLQDGLGVFDPALERFTCYRHDPQDPQGISALAILSIAETEAGELWIGTAQGLDRLDRATGSFAHYRPDAGDPYAPGNKVIFSIYEDRSGTLWAGTYGGGLGKLDRETGDWNFYRHDPGDPHSLSNDFVTSIQEDRKGGLWVGTFGGGLNRLDRETGAFTHYRYDSERPQSLSSDTVMAVFVDSADTLWVGTFGGGLNRLDRETGGFVHYRHDPTDTSSLAHDHITSIYEDAAGILWIGTNGGGVSRLDPLQKPFKTYSLGPDPAQRQDVHAVYADRDGVLWLGLYGAGLLRLDRNSGSVRRYLSDPRDPTSLSHNDVSAILRDRNGTLWIATWGGGLDRFEPDMGTFAHYQHNPSDPCSLSTNDVTVLHEDRSGFLWVGTSGGGLNRLDSESECFAHLTWDPQDPASLSHNTVSSLEEDSTGRLWISTLQRGLDRFEPETETFEHHQPEPEKPYIANNRVLTIVQGQAHTLWLGTQAGGLIRFELDAERFTPYTPADGLMGNQIQGIAVVNAPSEDGFANTVLWLSTNRGLARFEPETGSFRTYDASDGLPANAFNQGATYQGPDGELFFGSVGGLVSFYPGEIQEDPRVPAIFITELQLNNQPVRVGNGSVLERSILETDALTLSPPYRNVAFEFTALSYTAPEKSQYRYILEGLDDGWTEVGSMRRFASYTNLRPGTYRFRVIGSNPDGVWNEEGDSLTVTVRPYWWETIWFRGGLLLLAVGLAFAGFQYRTYNLKRRARMLESQVAARTQELHESREKYRSLVEQVSDVIYSLDQAGRITYVSPAISSLLGYQASDLLGHSFSEFIHPEDLEQVRGRFAYLAVGRSVSNAEYRLVTMSGDTRWVRASSQPIWEADQVAGVRGVLVDVSDRKQVEAQLKQAAAAAEREHLARDLHDSVTQSLFSAAAIADVLPGLWEQHPEEARHALADLRRLSQGSLAEMRAMLLALRPDALADKSLGDLLRQLAETMLGRTRTPVTTTVAGDCPLPTAVKISLYRIAQEALNNAIKHSRCSQVRIGLICESGRVEVHVRDDGRGFDLPSAEPHRMGLKIMRERAEVIGAALEIDTAPGQGTDVRVTWEGGEALEDGQQSYGVI